MMPNINVNIEENDIEACHRFGKLDVRLKSKKTIVQFVNRKICNKIFENKKKLAKLNKNNFTERTKILISDDLTPMNEPTAFNCRKLKCKELIHSCYNRNEVIYIRMSDKSFPVNFFRLNDLLIVTFD